MVFAILCRISNYMGYTQLLPLFIIQASIAYITFGASTFPIFWQGRVVPEGLLVMIQPLKVLTFFFLAGGFRYYYY